MKTLSFVKMEGAGNDYVFLDRFCVPFESSEGAALAVELSDRHHGVGGDGLIVLAPSDRADCRMLMWNADGSRGAMCGNGIRCLAKLAHDHGHVASPRITVESDAGLHAVELVFDGGGQVVGARVDMGEVRVEREPHEFRLAGQSWHVHRGSAGNHHAVIFWEEDLAQAPVAAIGAALQQHATFPAGVNVEFVRVVGQVLEQRTYERGSGETLACGTGATVAALAAWVTGRLLGPSIEVRLRGGTLVIHRSGSHLVMEGPARTVFSGTT